MRLRAARLTVPSVCFALLGTAACDIDGSSRPAVVGTVTYATESGRRYFHPRVGEDGFNFQVPLEISGYKGQRLQVAIFTDRGDYLGSEPVVPGFEATVWEKFRVFVPHVNLRNISEDTGFSVYVLSPNDTNTFIEKVHYSRSNIRPPQLAWEWLRYEVEAPMDGGGKGIRLTLNLHTRGYVGHPMRAVTLVRGRGLQDFPVSKGGPYRIDGTGLTVRYDPGVFENLELTVRYDDLERLDPAQEVVLTPSVRIDDQIVAGNVHVHVWAGGALKAVERRIQRRIEDYDAEIDDLQRRLQVLQRE